MRLRAIAFLLILIWFFAWAGDGLNAWFTDDELMNFYFATDAKWSDVAKDNLLFFGGSERPVTKAAYKGLWSAFGFHPMAYRVVCFAVLAVNLGLAWALFRRLSGSEGVAAIAALLFSYHAALSDLYLSTATLYDALAFLFYFTALLWYLTIRQCGRAPSRAEVVGLALLTVLAVNSKEIAVTLPVMMAATEWIYGDRRQWRGPVAAIVAAGLIVMGRLLWPGSQAVNPAYQMQFGLGIWLDRMSHYLFMLLYVGGTWTKWHALAVLAGCVAAAWALKRREAWWAVTLIFLGPLPVLFIDARSLYAIYLALPGFCLLAGCSVERLVVLARPKWRYGPALAAMGIAVWLWPLHAARKPLGMVWYLEQEARLKAPGIGLSTELAQRPPGATVLISSDEFRSPPEDNHTGLFLVRLITGDHTIGVFRGRSLEPPVSDGQWDKFTSVIQLTRGGAVRLK